MRQLPDFAVFHPFSSYSRAEYPFFAKMHNSARVFSTLRRKKALTKGQADAYTEVNSSSNSVEPEKEEFSVMLRFQKTVRVAFCTAAAALLLLVCPSCSVVLSFPQDTGAASTPGVTTPAAPSAPSGGGAGTAAPGTPNDKDETNGPSSPTPPDSTPSQEPDPGTPPDPDQDQEPNPTPPEPQPQPQPGDDMTVPAGYTATWKNENGTLVLTRYTPPTPFNGTLQLPTGPKNYKIDTAFFASAASVEHVDFPANVLEIGEYAFMGSGLESLTLPSTVAKIGNSAFQGCDSLTSLTLKGNYSANSLGTSLFANCSALTSVSFEGTLRDIPEGMFNFSGSEDGLCIALPNGLSSIGKDAFTYSVLTSIYIPSSVETIDLSAFAETYDFTVYYGGTEEQWQTLTAGNDSLADITVHYNASGLPTATPVPEALNLLRDVFALF